MKLIFLDIDGVLVMWKSMEDYKPEPPMYHPRFDKSCVAALNDLIKRTGAEIFISSSWRIGSCDNFLQLVGYIKDQGVI